MIKVATRQALEPNTLQKFDVLPLPVHPDLRPFRARGEFEYIGINVGPFGDVCYRIELPGNCAPK